MKKTVTKEQLLKDGIAQLKTKRQLINEGILTKEDFEYLEENDSHSRNFRNTKENPHMLSEMLNDLGKSLKIIDDTSNYYNNENKVSLKTTHNIVDSWDWPIECILK